MKEFKRLRGLKRLGNSSEVYPAASHSRLGRSWAAAVLKGWIVVTVAVPGWAFAPFLGSSPGFGCVSETCGIKAHS